MWLLLLACAPPVMHLAYDPLGSAPIAPLLGGEILVVGAEKPLVVRNAADHVVWVNEVDVVPAGAARLGRVALPAEVAPDATWSLPVRVEAPGQLVLRTSDGVRFVALRPAGDVGVPAPGTRDRAGIAAIVEGELPALSRCYQDALAVHRELRGRVRMKFVIEPDGRVSSVGFLESTLATGDVEACLGTVMRRVDFGAQPDGGVVVVAYPFVFEPGSG